MPEYTSRVYQVGNRWEYQVLQDGAVSIHQDYHPDDPGHFAMSQASATAWAAEAIAQCVYNDAQQVFLASLLTAEDAARSNDADKLAAAKAASFAAQAAALTAQAALTAANATAVATV
jgi:hypothetical protein